MDRLIKHSHLALLALGFLLLTASCGTSNPNQAPTIITFSTSQGIADPNTDIAFRWDIQDPDDTLRCELDLNGDGETQVIIEDCTSDDHLHHTYPEQGVYNTTLRVTDQQGETDSATLTIIITINAEEKALLQASQRVWEQLKQSNDTNYRYTVTQDALTGDSVRTTLEVQDDAVVMREAHTITYDEFTGDITSKFNWIEFNDQVGSHDDAYPPSTIEQVYEKCLTEVLTQDPMTHAIQLFFDSDGLLSSCYAIALDCQDDCVKNIRLEKLAFIQKTAFDLLWAESFETWLDLKAERLAQNHVYYTYSSTTYSWTGYRTLTGFDVVSDVVTLRWFEENEYNEETGEFGDELVHQWTEFYETGIGTHNEGFLPRNVEEVYLHCRDQFLSQDPEESYVTFGVHADGILDYCYGTPRDWADVSFGININNLQY